MALVLAMRVGQDVFAGDHRLVVSWMDTPFRFGIRKEDGTITVVTDQVWVTVVPGVRVQAGIPRNQESSNLVRLQFDAPGVTIARGALYRKAPPDHHEKSVVAGSCFTCNGLKVLRDTIPCGLCNGHGCSTCHGVGSIKQDFKCPDCS